MGCKKSTNSIIIIQGVAKFVHNTLMKTVSQYLVKHCLTLKKVDTIVNKNGENQKETEEIQSRRKNGDGEASLSRRRKSLWLCNQSKQKPVAEKAADNS